ncbi:capsule assembly Wzi family protein [Granulicella aggregans]|uniref:capsule assembly Wzi family protein n=1 Tax=Granulicella aggregans TaxID=474949 RepID=UPI0021E023B7|nr:capsule assembly Wzi family protein [Granulicella aggregans]
MNFKCSKPNAVDAVFCVFLSLVASGIPCIPSALAQGPTKVQPYNPVDVYVPIDSWVYPALDRLRGLGYLDRGYFGLRPWTRRSIAQMIQSVSSAASLSDDPEAFEVLAALRREFPLSPQDSVTIRYDSVYSRVHGIAGTPLRDSYHLGQSVFGDYGRPYQSGINILQGASISAQAARFSLFFRGEYQHAPSAPGYSPSLAASLAANDGVPLVVGQLQATVPAGPLPEINVFRVVEANLSLRLLDHEISFGKSDHWLGPDRAGSFIYSNNAENLYAFQIDRVEPFQIPLLSRVTGPFRYMFMVGSLQGHTYPNDPWMHTEKISFKPTENVEIGFARSVIWGGKGHAPITVHSFLKSFLSLQNVSTAEKESRDDPGARFSEFDFTWRLPFLRHWATLYCDTIVHDDVSAVDAPRHAGLRPGIYLAMVPWIPKMDLRVEGANTDPPTGRSLRGSYLYTESIQKQGYTNKGFLMGDVAGREGKDGEGWLDYHISPRETIDFNYRHAKVAKDFVASGVTQNDFGLGIQKRVHEETEISLRVQQEWWKAPVYLPGKQSDTSVIVQVQFFPKGLSVFSK